LFDPYISRLGKFCLGGRVVGAGLALEMVDVFLDTEFEGGRHQRRVDQIMAIQDGIFED
jgi:ribose 5-phosphate isomerase B